MDRPRKVVIFDPVQLSKQCPPKKFLRVVATNIFVYEVDKVAYTEKGNLLSVGPCFGKILDPFGLEYMVKWDNGDQEAVPRKNLRVALQPGEAFVDGDKTYECRKYSAKGCHCWVEATEKQEVNKAGTAKAMT